MCFVVCFLLLKVNLEAVRILVICIVLFRNIKIISMISHFINTVCPWLIIQGTMESKILGGGGCRFFFSIFVFHVRDISADMLSFRLILDIYALF